MELMECDVKAADLVLWVGISFQQSASTLYFRKVRAWIQVGGQERGCRLCAVLTHIVLVCYVCAVC